MTPLKVGFIGLGAMGLPMAGHLAKAGFLAGVWNRSHDKAATAAKTLGVAAPADAAELIVACNVIALCVPADADVVHWANEIAAHAHRGQVPAPNRCGRRHRNRKPPLPAPTPTSPGRSNGNTRTTWRTPPSTARTTLSPDVCP